MIKIRLMRIGAKQKPFYRIVAVDERAKRTGGYIELLGTYNPLTEPKDIKLKQDRIDYWIKQGAQPSHGFLRMTGKAPQRPPRKPKKQKQESSDTNQAGEPKSEETVQRDSENSEKKESDSVRTEDRNFSESESQKEQISETSETPIPSGSSATPSPSESSEKKESES